MLLLPLVSLGSPTLDVVAPKFLLPNADIQSKSLTAPHHVSAVVAASQADQTAIGTPADWALWGYALPGMLLASLVLMSLARLLALKSRATALDDVRWLTPLARAQRRMRFRRPVALLASDRVVTPISWGVVRPVILLNRAAADSRDGAEAIIVHELAHIARVDWARLLLTRIAVALYWFNPFVWILARAAHELREDAADDAVLASGIDETSYANLLVSTARLERHGILACAHGIAPMTNSLGSRVRRVLSGRPKRGPAGRRWMSAAALSATAITVPFAAVNLVHAEAASPKAIPSSVAQTSQSGRSFEVSRNEKSDSDTRRTKMVATDMTANPNGSHGDHQLVPENKLVRARMAAAREAQAIADRVAAASEKAAGEASIAGDKGTARASSVIDQADHRQATATERAQELAAKVASGQATHVHLELDRN